MNNSLKPTIDLLRSRREELIAIAAKHGASNIRVFGSVARGEATNTSDLDLLIEFRTRTKFVQPNRS